MTFFIILAALLGWSLSRQMREHAVTREGLIKLPLIFGGIGLLSLSASDMPHGSLAVVEVIVSVGLSVGLGMVRGALMPTWRGEAGQWMTRGNRTTIALWVGLVASKFVIGAIGSITGLYSSTGTGEIFLILGLSFAAQNYILARRTIASEAPAHALVTH
jgi:hypothetical protein